MTSVEIMMIGTLAIINFGIFVGMALTFNHKMAKKDKIIEKLLKGGCHD